MDTKLHVGTTGFHADFTQYSQGGVPHDLIFFISQRLRWCDGDGVTCVDTHGIEVLDGAHDYAVICLVAHNFHLILFPANQRLIDEQLVGGREIKPAGTDLLKLVLVVCNTTAGATHGERGTNDAWEADVCSDLPRLFHSVCNGGTRTLKANCLHCLVETAPIFGFVDGVGVGANHFHTVLGQHSVLFQFQCAVQCRLAAHGWQYGIRSFFFYNFGNGLPGNRLDVGGIRHHRVGHNGGRVRVNQDDAVAFLTQGFTGLGSGVVKFARLPDYNRACAQNQDAFNIGPFWHVLVNL